MEIMIFLPYFYIFFLVSSQKKKKYEKRVDKSKKGVYNGRIRWQKANRNQEIMEVSRNVCIFNTILLLLLYGLSEILGEIKRFIVFEPNRKPAFRHAIGVSQCRAFVF